MNVENGFLTMVLDEDKRADRSNSLAILASSDSKNVYFTNYENIVAYDVAAPGYDKEWDERTDT